MTPRMTYVLGLAAVAVLAFLAVRSLRSRQGPAGPASILETMPLEASFVATVRVEPLRRAGLLPDLREPAPLRRDDANREGCKVDPLDQAQVAAIFVGSERGDLDLGVSALGQFSATSIVACATEQVSSRGGEPRVMRMGTFHTVRDARGQEGEVAIRDEGPLLLGGATSLRAMIDAVEGRSDSMVSNPAHAALRSAVGREHTIIGSWIASPATHAALERRIEGDSPLRAVRAAAFGLSLEADATVRLHLVVGARDARGAILLGRWLDEAAGRLDVRPAPELSIDGVEVTARVRLPMARVRQVLGLDEKRTNHGGNMELAPSPP